MTGEQASAHAATVYSALVRAETHHPESKALKLLHAALYDAWQAFHDANPGVVQPFDGTNKPPPGP